MSYGLRPMSYGLRPMAYGLRLMANGSDEMAYYFSLTMFRIQIPDLTRLIETMNLLKSAAREMK